MWLINTDTFKLERWGNYKKGSYAILSHTWGDDEVSFQEYQDLEFACRKGGFAKIERTVLKARARGLKFAWVDTCCTIQTHHRRQRPTKRVAYAAENGGRTYIAFDPTPRLTFLPQ
ncbi:hypothetical protein F5Y06DRAFT_6097 [Hypoxylon sp. FL0890]|nr:hypothetical protein F5Y06DRAFT_6097 [Hypoxylon sp. FL0890]